MSQRHDLLLLTTGVEPVFSAFRESVLTAILSMTIYRATLPLSQIDDLIDESLSASQEDGPGVYMHESPGLSLIERQFGRDYRLIELPDLRLHEQLFPNGVHPIVLDRHDSSGIPLNNRRKFWLDFVPHPILAAGAMVDLLVRTNVGHYIDFRALDGLFVEFSDPDGLQLVPGSRADVFQNRFISILEKRLLMRFVKKCYEGNEDFGDGRALEGRPSSDAIDAGESRRFKDEMALMGLTEKLQRFLVHSIAFATGKEERISSTDGVNAVRLYQQSMVKFGTKTPFLYANYGSGELSQAFCRLCAVNGGVYVLRRGAAAFVKRTRIEGDDHEEIDADRSRTTSTVGVVTTEHELIKCKNVFISRQLAERMNLGDRAADFQTGEIKVWRLMAIIDGSIVCDTGLKRIMVTVPRGTSGNENSAVRIRQLDDAVMVCPQGFFVLYAESIEPSGCERDVLEACRRYVDLSPNKIAANEEREGANRPLSHLEDPTTGEDEMLPCEAESKPRMLWGVTYLRKRGMRPLGEEGIVLVSEADYGHDTDEVIAEAKRCFGVVHPVDEFFRLPPSAPESNEDEQPVGVPTVRGVEQDTENGFEERERASGSQVSSESG